MVDRSGAANDTGFGPGLILDHAGARLQQWSVSALKSRGDILYPLVDCGIRLFYPACYSRSIAAPGGANLASSSPRNSTLGSANTLRDPRSFIIQPAQELRHGRTLQSGQQWRRIRSVSSVALVQCSNPSTARSSSSRPCGVNAKPASWRNFRRISDSSYG